MTWRSAIFSSGAATAGLKALPPAFIQFRGPFGPSPAGKSACSTWDRRFRLSGFVATIALLLATPAHGAEVTGKVTLHNSTVAAAAKRGDYSGVVVALQAVGETVPAAPRHATMLQKNKTFTPHVLPIVVGSTVGFPNSDPIFHNAFSSYSGQVFDVGLYPPGGTRSVRFNRPGVVRVFCNIHPSMSAVILVLNTPWFASTAKDGSFHLDVPPGTYDMTVFHERATAQTLQNLTQRVIVRADGAQIKPIEVSEAGYLLAPHKNKYGADYGPEPDDKILYSGARKE
jgi:plastocyanin